MSELRRIVHVESGETLVERARWCDTFTNKLRGFMLRRELATGEGLILVENRESRLNTAIHMLFVFFSLGVLWVDDGGRVVDSVVAQPWRLSYTPQAPARYVIEGHPQIIDHVAIGDYVRFIEISGG